MQPTLLIIWLDLHHHRFHRVVEALPTGPSYSAHLMGITTMEIMAVQIAVTACFVPPRTSFHRCTVMIIGVVVVTVSSGELHSQMIRQ